MVGYIIKFKNNNIIYQIGKRYHCIKYFFKELKDINKLIFYDYSDIMILKIKIFNSVDECQTNDFKILNEINYDEISKIDMLKFKILSFVKNQTEESFNLLVEEKEKCSEIDKKLINLAIIDAKNYDYINRIKERPRYFKIHLIKIIGRNKDITKFIKNKDKNVLHEIIKIGRPRDLDILMESKNNWLISKILLHGRKKDQIFYKEIIVIFDKKCYNKSKQNEEKK